MNKNRIYNAFLTGIISLLIVIPISVLAEEPTASPTPEATDTPVVTPSPSPSSEPVVDVTGVEISLSNIPSLTVGDTKKLTAKVTPDNATNQEVIWSSKDESIATVDQTGKVTAKKKGTTTIIVKSKANSDITSSCEVTVVESDKTPEPTKEPEKEETKSSDASIKKLSIKNGEMDKKFDPNVYDYTVTVSKDVKELEFEYTFNHSKANRYVTNNSSIITGSKVKFYGVAEDGTKTKAYVFTVKKEEVNLNLSSLKIKGYALNETFKADKLEYTADIPFEAVDVTIQAALEDEDNEVDITGATSLIVGENTVIITVKDNYGNKKEYKIIVTRASEDEREETGNSSKYTSSTSDKVTSTDTKDDGNSGTKTNNTLRYVLVTIGCIILFAIGGIGVYFYIKTSSRKNKKNTIKSDSNENKITTNDSAPYKSDFNPTSIMPEEQLELTREFKPEELKRELNKTRKDDNKQEEIETLFDDE